MKTKVQNKWNKKIYTVDEVKANSIVLIRDDNSKFEIQLSEYKFNYFEIQS